ncbi:MAG: hypothetical protein D8H93_15145 [Capnocytophaga sp.]|nr:MAG: hypothetical protein D8H93_15145 [Capnocytophaga sp.]
MFKQENFTFVDVVSLIFLLLLFVGNFVGALFLFSNFWVAVGIGLLIFLGYYGIIRLLKRNKQTLVSKHYKTPLSVLFVGFLLLALASGVLTAHTINIQTNVKEKVQAEAQEKIAQVADLFAIYRDAEEASMQQYHGQLERLLKAYKKKPTHGLEDQLLAPPYEIDEQTLADIKHNSIKDIIASRKGAYELKIREHFDQLNQIMAKDRAYAENFKHWNWFKVATDYQELNQFVQQSYDEVGQMLAALPFPAEAPLSLEMDNTRLPLDSFTELNEQYSPNYLLIVGVFVVIHFFILIPYFLHKVRAYKTEQEKDDRIIEY